MPAEEEDFQVLPSPPIFSWRNYFIPLLLLTLVLAFFTATYFSELSIPPREIAREERLNPVEVASEVGYEVVEAEEGDSSGRTVVYKDRFLFDGIGGVFSEFPYIVARAISWQQEEDSLLLRLEPIDKNKEASFLISESMDVWIEDLGAKDTILIPLGSIRLIGVQTLQSAVQEGDVVALVYGKENPLSEDAAIEAIGLALRRFGGIAALEEELGVRFDTPRR